MQPLGRLYQVDSEVCSGTYETGLGIQSAIWLFILGLEDAGNFCQV
jgi:hypothetical protein